MTFDLVAERGDDKRKDVLPILHLYCQVRQTDAELNPDGLGTRCVLLQEGQDLGPKRSKSRGGHLSRQVIGDLGD